MTSKNRDPESNAPKADEKKTNKNNDWKILEERHDAIDRATAHGEIKEKKKPAAKEFKPKKLKQWDPENIKQNLAAIRIQRKWRQVLSSDEKKLVSVRVGERDKKDNPEFIFFLHGQKIKKTLNLKLRKAFKEAIEAADWSKILSFGENAYYLAVALSQRKEITADQRNTVLDVLSTTKDFKLKDIFPVLDADGKFTVEAAKFLLPALEKTGYLKKLTPESREKFRQLILQLPKSEQFFYLTSSQRVGADSQNSGAGYLADLMMQTGALLHSQGDHKKLSGGADGMPSPAAGPSLGSGKQDAKQSPSFEHIFLTTGVRNALGIARYGVKQHVASRARLGPFTKQEIQEGVRQGYRSRDTRFPGVKSPEGVHDFEVTVAAETASHDDHHANILSALPMPARLAVLRIIDVIRDDFKDFIAPKDAKADDIFSKEIWEYIDADFRYFVLMMARNPDFDPEKLSVQEMTQHFSEMLHLGSSNDRYSPRRSYLMIKSGDTLSMTPVGIAVIIDMFSHRDKWLEMGIDPRHLNKPFKEFYTAMEQAPKIPPLITEEKVLSTKPEAIFCWQVYFALQQQNKADEFAKFIEWFNQAKSPLKIGFKKRGVKESDSVHIKNSISLVVNGKVGDEEVSTAIAQFRKQAAAAPSTGLISKLYSWWGGNKAQPASPVENKDVKLKGS
jgi:hypothetical protein